MKTIREMFEVDVGKRLDYEGAITMYHFLQEESIAAASLIPDVVLDIDNYPLYDEQAELNSFMLDCELKACDLKQWVKENMWEFRYSDFVSHIDYLGFPLSSYRIRQNEEAAKLLDEDLIRSENEKVKELLKDFSYTVDENGIICFQ